MVKISNFIMAFWQSLQSETFVFPETVLHCLELQ
nr:MAG TPA: hypothetical protein [Caudoviricetes sp.]